MACPSCRDSHTARTGTGETLISFTEDTKMATKKILVVDDNADIRKVIKAALSQRKYRIVEADDGAAAIKKLHAEKIDLLIADFDMPGANGIEVMEKALSLYPKMPIVLVSGLLSPEVRKKATCLASHIVEKPFNIAALARTVSKLIT
jgi:CheY-like chemotaxis protein